MWAGRAGPSSGIGLPWRVGGVRAGPSAGPVPAWLRGGTAPRKDTEEEEEGVSAGLEAGLRGEGRSL